MSKPKSTPAANARGTRDFLPHEVARRTHIAGTIRQVFEDFGYQPIETPALENLQTLTGKYGEEGDQLLFKVLNSGDFNKDLPADWYNLPAKALAPLLAEKALRYDLTVPFARFVVQHRNDLAFPFKRYQLQPVWRADRPQKGRYREFWQCDADVVGSESLLHEADFIQMYDRALSALGLPGFSIRLNHRRLLNGLAAAVGQRHQFVELITHIDKKDKLTPDKFRLGLVELRLTDEQIALLDTVLSIPAADPHATLLELEQHLGHEPEAQAGLADLRQLLAYVEPFPRHNATVVVDPTLARGLNYYTGPIFEVKAHGVQIGSIGGGGRYDNLCGLFGWQGVPGAGISFGLDRIYDVMEELGLFADLAAPTVQVLVAHFDPIYITQALQLAADLRRAGITVEVYPDPVKLAKQFTYADRKGIPYVALIGAEEAQAGVVKLKNMKTGDQQALTTTQVIALLSA